MKDVIRKILKPILGKLRFQAMFELLHKFSLVGMNMASDGSIENSGEKNVLKYIDKKFKSNNDLVLFDVGANIGSYSGLLKDFFSDQAVIYAFEPSKKTFDKLESNVINLKNIKIFNYGFGDQDYNSILYSDGNESGFASLYNRRLNHFNIELKQKEEVTIKTVDNFCANNGVSHINFLKIDVEGNELKVLQGAKKMIDSGNIDFIQFEFGGCNIDSRTYFQDFYYLLKDNYKIYRIVKDGLRPIYRYSETCEIFLNSNYLAERILN